MARVALHRRRYTDKINKLWPHQWSNIPRYAHENLEKYMRKILIYYPKNLRALKPVTGEASTRLAWLVRTDFNFEQGTEEEITRLETLYMQILAKYKRGYVRHQNIDINYKDPYTYRPNRLETLRLYQSEKGRLSFPNVLRRMLKLSQSIKHLEIDGSVACVVEVIESIDYMPSLESLYIDNFSKMSLRALEKSLGASRVTLKTITITGILKVNPVKLFRIFAGLPKLKAVNLEGEFQAKFDIREIPYKMFRERDIRFNIRLRYFKGEVKLATKDRLGIAPVDYLGLDCKQLRPNFRPVWDPLREKQVKLQENSKRVLCLNIPFIKSNKQWRTSKLFRACKEVKILDIGLARGPNWRGNEFANLKYLKKLEHVFITLEMGPITTVGDSLLRNLVFCASTLRSINLHIFGEVHLKDGVPTLLKSCANTLTHFVLKLTYCRAKNLYAWLQELKHLISLKVIYEYFPSDNLGPHANKMPFTCTTLKEISLIAPLVNMNQLNLEFQHLTNLEKMQLSVKNLEDDSIIFKKRLVIPESVRHLELDIYDLGENLWYKLLAQLSNIPELEILMLQMRYMIGHSENNSENEIKKSIRINDIKALFKRHKSLKCVVYGDGYDDGYSYGYGWDLKNVNVVVEDVVCCSEEDIDNFFARCRFDDCLKPSLKDETPRKRMQRVFRVQKEITEEVVASQMSVEMNRGFTGFIKDIFNNVKSRYFANG